jgi:hypothetical protein
VRNLSAAERTELTRIAGMLALDGLLDTILTEPDEIAG